MGKTIRHILLRRQELRRLIDVERNFHQWEESCVPSYCHDNFLAAFVSWERLFVAARLFRRFKEDGNSSLQVLDFGSSVGEIKYLLPENVKYHFVEKDDAASRILMKNHSSAIKVDDIGGEDDKYDAIFAIDSLEHNDDYAILLRFIARRLSKDGILIISGPTENWLYKIGRWIAGFQGDYHKTTIYDIEVEAKNLLEMLALRRVPFGIPLFRISVWKMN